VKGIIDINDLNGTQKRQLLEYAGKNAEIDPLSSEESDPLPSEEIDPPKSLQIDPLSSEENDPHWKCLN
jgi:hypothetical protein